MSTPSAEFTVNGVAYTGIVTVAPGATVTLALVSTFGVSTVQWSIVGNHSPGATNPTITPAGSPSGITATFTFPATPADQNYLIQCRINGGRDRLKRLVPGYFFRALIGSGALPLALGEKLERHPVYGWLLAVNTGISGELSLTGAAPSDLSLTAAAVGSSEDASPADHVHTVPTQAANTVLANVTTGSARPTAAAPQSLIFQSPTSGAGSIRGQVAPQGYGAVTTLATAANVNVDIALPDNGHYAFVVVCHVRLATAGTFRTVEYKVFGNRAAGALTIEGAPYAVGGGDTSGIALTISATGGSLRVNVANTTGETVSGRVHVGWFVEDLLT